MVYNDLVCLILAADGNAEDRFCHSVINIRSVDIEIEEM